MKSEKCEKSNSALFRLEPAVSQSVPFIMGWWDFSDFSKNFWGYTGGGSAFAPSLPGEAAFHFSSFLLLNSYFPKHRAASKIAIA
ncbi:MAG: hypothetical protein ACLQU4_09615 [Limisphaerales bacterium]